MTKRFAVWFFGWFWDFGILAAIACVVHAAGVPLVEHLV